jgi:RNA polymerase sigma-70 factor, ECF subfamily
VTVTDAEPGPALDSGGFAAWVSPPLPVLSALAVRSAGPDDAEDLVQDTLVRAWRRLETYRPDRGSPRAWLIAVLYDQARRRRLRAVPVAQVRPTAAVIMPERVDVDPVAASRSVGGTMNDSQLDEVLRAWGNERRSSAPAIEVAHDRLSEAGTGHGGHRWRWAVGASAAAVLAVAGAVALFHSAGNGSHVARPAHTDSRTIGAAEPTSYTDLVVRDGDTVTASGIVVAVKGRQPRLCAPRTDDLVGTTGPRLVERCAAGLDLVGVDMSKVSGRYVHDGSVEGSASITGTLHAGTISVTAQAKPSPYDFPSLFQVPPCPAPTGGWPIGGPGNLDAGPAQRYARAHPGTVFEFALLRPSKRQVVAYALTTGEPAPVDAALRPAYGARLCVFRSRYTHAEVKAARRPFERRMGMGQPADEAPAIITVGEGLSATSQAEVDVQLDWVTPELAAAAAQQPAGLVRLDPWLRPVR